VASPEPAKQAASQPYVPAYVTVAEITVKGVLLGLLLAVLLGAANTYLGLKAGLTVSASIPAAVISMGVLRLFRKSTVLENNMVQTIASAGEAVAGGILFTIPALLIVNYWHSVHYWETTVVGIVGGVLGVLFTVPLRRALIVEENLAFPEGVATAEVLKSGDKGGSGVGILLAGGITGAVYKLVESGLKMFQENALFTQQLGGRVIYGIGSALSPALMGVGTIVGLRVASLVFAGGAFAWLVAMPIYTGTHPDLGNLLSPSLDATALGVWKLRVRYLGVGAMLVGGIWSLIKLRKPLGRAMGQGLRSRKAPKDAAAPPRTEVELSARTTFLGVAALLVPMFLFYAFISRDVRAPASAASPWVVAAVMSLLMVVTGFLFSAVGAYMAGLVGSSNNPISGVTILTLIVSAFMLKALGLGADIGPAITIFIAAVIAVAGSIASDNLQDLKAGYMLGSTPRKQQFMLMVGAVGSAFVLAPVVQVLVKAYPVGSASLPAPQASLMASVAQGIFGAGLPYGLIGIGAGLAVLLVAADLLLQRAGSTFRIPVMAVAVGIYLPITVSTPIFLGGVAGWLAERYVARRWRSDPAVDQARLPEMLAKGAESGILFASGLIAGEALVGILVALLVGVGAGDALALGKASLQWPGLLLLLYVTFATAYTVARPAILARRQA
jgi:putative OPT family oligopeptide transporter